VAELALGHMFACARFISVAGHTMREDKWEKKAYGKGFELQGKTLGIVGFGRIGQHLGVMAKAIGMKVVAFDIFHFDADGRIAEHWDNLAAKADPNPSGHTQIDGCKELKDLDRTEANRELVKNFLADVLQGRHPEKTPEYFDGDTYIQHNTGIADGLSGLGSALAALAEQGIQMIYTTVHQVLAQGN
jgi:predicted SnoaL-like aldol condensation-catalyzing enzyme